MILRYKIRSVHLTQGLRKYRKHSSAKWSGSSKRQENDPISEHSWVSHNEQIWQECCVYTTHVIYGSFGVPLRVCLRRVICMTSLKILRLGRKIDRVLLWATPTDEELLAAIKACNQSRIFSARSESSCPPYTTLWFKMPPGRSKRSNNTKGANQHGKRPLSA